MGVFCCNELPSSIVHEWYVPAGSRFLCSAACEIHENIVWSDETKYELFGCHNRHYLDLNRPEYHLKTDVWRWEYHDAAAYDTGKRPFKERMNGNGKKSLWH